ncbi:MAG: hypothetical protein ACD_42C00408G0010 [uncultured bacterium]|nr:MAG: hypothetical protein ACD_42C00408G0010 [uncultured bacterium]OGT32876.1 MAG: glycine cleavage system protein T [Gammaproteobacteria bacterium RIFCSPHIGHO2_02_FULL_39_13]OGT50534.1 MAG: glycine cleavage system protein T [Gammaproteobacteria bacterium RIFCSPHIGHO2_12_FULL_39_24]
MSKKTPLYDQHLKSKALIVDFSGWQMPLHYGSQIQEHHAVRNRVGLFDVSHMGVVTITGKDTVGYLRFLLANDVAKLKNTGDALYSCMLNENGGVIDDLIAYRFSESHFKLVINAGCREKDVAWMQLQAKNFSVQLKLRDDLCLLALQGPDAIAMLENIFDKNIAEKIAQLKPFQFYDVTPTPTTIARTGYTGESGVEMMLPTQAAIAIWEKCIALGIQPCGLGARDTLRLEAGLNLYGADMNENTSPLISNLSWTVSFRDEAREFIGKKALLKEKQNGLSQQLVGLILEDKGILRNHQKIKINNNSVGEITSGGFSPTLNKSIAFARIPMTTAEKVLVERRGEWLSAKIVKPKFI